MGNIYTEYEKYRNLILYSGVKASLLMTCGVSDAGSDGRVCSGIRMTRIHIYRSPQLAKAGNEKQVTSESDVYYEKAREGKGLAGCYEGMMRWALIRPGQGRKTVVRKGQSEGPVRLDFTP